jgi:hypothetical protein
MSSAKQRTQIAREILRESLKRPIAFYAALARIGGGTCSGVFLSQAYYWSQRTKHPDGWFFKTQAEWTEETRLSRTEQETVRRNLRSRGLLHESKRGNPQRLWFRIDEEAIATAITDSSHIGSHRNAEDQPAQKAPAANPPAGKLRPELEEYLRPELEEYLRPEDEGIPQPLKDQRLQDTTPETTSLVLFPIANQANNEAVIFLPLNDRTEHGVTKEEVSEWVSLYPAIEVVQQLRNMRGWLLANPRKRKTKAGIDRFITNWLAGKQDQTGGSIGGNNQNNRRLNGAFHSGERYEREPDSDM